MSRVAIILFAVFLLLPLWFMFTGSLTDVRGVLIMPPRLWPTRPTLENYQWIATLPAVPWILNTAIVTVFGTVISVAVSVMAGYAFAFYRFRFKRVLWLLLLSGIMIPRISLIIPRFVVIRQLGLSGGLWAVILPAALHPISVYLARNYFETVPPSLMESARIDGANEWQILWRVVAPVSKPIVTALSLFTAVIGMSDYLWQMLQLQRQRAQTLLVGLMNSVMTMGGNEVNVNPIGKQLAVGMVLLAPLLVVFFVASRYFTTALGGAVKG